MGTLHGGGVLAIWQDATSVGVAYRNTLAPGGDFDARTDNFLRPVWKAKLRAEARVVGGGKTVGLVECDVFDPRGRLVARASSTCCGCAARPLKAAAQQTSAPDTRRPTGDRKSSFRGGSAVRVRAIPAFR